MTTYQQGENAVLSVQWDQSIVGPAVDVTAQTVSILTLNASVILAPTSAGIVHVATGLYSYTYPVPASLAAGSYVTVWSATYSGSPVSVSETFTVTSSAVSTVVGVDNVVYCTLEDVKGALDVKATTRSDRQIIRGIRASTLGIEGLMGGRKFYPVLTTKYKDWPDMPSAGAYPWRVWLDEAEAIALTTVTSGGIVIPPSQYLLEPVNDGPPYDRIEINLGSDASFSSGATWQQSLALAGLFGYSANTEAAGTLTASISTTTTTTALVSDSSIVGVGTIIQVDSERMIVTAKQMVTTGQIQQADMASSAAVVTLLVTDATQYAVGETLLLDAERMLIVDSAGNNLIVKRNWDGSVLASHSGATIYAARQCTVIRGVLGTTASTHSTSSPILAHVFPSLIRSLCVAETINTLLQEESGYARTVGSGDNARNASGGGLKELRALAVVQHGKKSRLRAI